MRPPQKYRIIPKTHRANDDNGFSNCRMMMMCKANCHQIYKIIRKMVALFFRIGLTHQLCASTLYDYFSISFFDFSSYTGISYIVLLSFVMIYHVADASASATGNFGSSVEVLRANVRSFSLVSLTMFASHLLPRFYMYYCNTSQ